MKMEETNKILIVDDEPTDIAALLRFLNGHSVPYEYRSTILHGVDAVIQAQLANKPYSLVVCDNHFSECIPGYPTYFDGINFAKIISGNDHTFDKEDERFIEEYFESLYDKIREHYRDRVIMFSGSAGKESIANPDLFSGLHIVQKQPFADTGECCEKGVLKVLESRLGYQFDENAAYTIEGYKISQSEYCEEDHLDQLTRAFLKENNIDPDDFE